MANENNTPAVEQAQAATEVVTTEVTAPVVTEPQTTEVATADDNKGSLVFWLCIGGLCLSVIGAPIAIIMICKQRKKIKKLEEELAAAKGVQAPVAEQTTVEAQQPVAQTVVEQQATVESQPTVVENKAE